MVLLVVMTVGVGAGVGLQLEFQFHLLCRFLLAASAATALFSDLQYPWSRRARSSSTTRQTRRRKPRWRPRSAKV